MFDRIAQFMRVKLGTPKIQFVFIFVAVCCKHVLAKRYYVFNEVHVRPACPPIVMINRVYIDNVSDDLCISTTDYICGHKIKY